MFSKKIIICFFVLLVCNTVFSFSSRKDLEEPEEQIEWQKIQGNVSIYGSMPHTVLGFSTIDEKVYALKFDENYFTDISIPEKDLRCLQGCFIELKGYAVENSDNYELLKDGCFVVAEYQIIE